MTTIHTPPPGNAQASTADIRDLPARIADRITINQATGCWVAGPPHDRDGYARLGDKPLHRCVFEMLVGPIAPGLVIDHVRSRGCISRACINPAHLEPVTVRVNTLRGNSFAAVNARKTICGSCSAPYDLFNTYWSPTGRRDCRSCIRRRVREYRARRRSEFASAA